MIKVTTAVSLATVVASAAPGVAAIREIPVTKMEALVRQGTLDGLGGLKELGTSGMRPKLERCYRRVSQSHDQTAAVYCMTEDRMITETMVQEFSESADPYFNTKAFAHRGATATAQVVQPVSAQAAFTRVLGAVQSGVIRQLSEEINHSEKPSQ